MPAAIFRIARPEYRIFNLLGSVDNRCIQS